ncbi:MAG: sugar transferase [Deltaproteobacteria bacterium]|nr:sugar transferase [Deltaproteobacteria bacterium]
MFQQQVYILNTFRMMLDAVSVIAAGYWARHLVSYYVPDVVWRMPENIFIVSVLMMMFVNNYVMGRMGMYGDRRHPSLWKLFWPMLNAVLIDFSVLASFVFIFEPQDYPRSFLLLFAGLCLVLMFAEKILLRIYIRFIAAKGFNVRRILVVGNMTRGKLVSDLLSSQVSWGHQVVGRLKTSTDKSDGSDSLGTLDDLPEVLRTHAIDEVVFAIDGDRTVNLARHLNYCRQTGIPARILPALWQPGQHGLSVDRLQGVPFFTIQTANFNATGLLYKRILDIIGGLVGTLIFLFIYPFVAVAIKLDSPGPVVFKQQRMGLNGRIFYLYKFRSMYLDAEQRKKELLDRNEMEGVMFKLKDDPRITKVGGWLRKTSLDEFPQFFNVLKGEMSLVGTRPPTLDEVEQYKPWHLRRISAKPGLTGLWQVSGRNKITNFDEIVELDCRYLDQWRFSDDLRILFKTVMVVLKRKGAI